MAKKIKFESFKYRLIIALSNLNIKTSVINGYSWEKFISDLNFSYQEGLVVVAWQQPSPGKLETNLTEAKFYTRSDKIDSTSVGEVDQIKKDNEIYFNELAMSIAQEVGFMNKLVGKEKMNNEDKTLQIERDFHDEWAYNENLDQIDILLANQSITAPEMRFIKESLGDIKGKTLLDVGCGLGEASVFFALLGADVTSVDLSQGMLDAATKLAKKNNVEIKTHLASADNINLNESQRYDIIYAGNLLHHVDIEKTLLLLKPHLAENGMMATWDPLAYNPIINIYRWIATKVRTPDEHPLTWKDLQLFKRTFNHVEVKYFWLTTLLIFILMFIVERRNPNKERFWKVVVQEGDKWTWLYRPLEKLDQILLKFIPPLRLLCWNVVVISK